VHRSLPGQQAGSSPAYQHAGVGLSGRTQNAGAAVLASGAEWVGDDVVTTSLCIATRKDGNPCVAKPVGDHDHCIGHLRGSERTS